LTRRRVTTPLLIATLLAAGVTARARPEPWDPPTRQVADDGVPAQVKEQRAIVLDAEAEVGSIAAAATHLLDRGDTATLHTALTGEAVRPALGVLQALGVAGAESAEPLIDDVLALAARSTGTPARKAADDVLDRQLAGAATGASAPPRVRRILGWVSDPLLDLSRRTVVLAALGRSGELAYVEPLVAALSGDSPAEVRAALRSLTGHDLGPEADAAVWRAWWAEHSRFTREQLLEQALELRAQELQVVRDDAGRAEQAATTKLVNLKIAGLGESVEGLLAGLADEHADVRLEAARRLAGKANDERAAAAVPVLLRRLGHAASPNGNGNGHAPQAEPAATATGDAGAVEADPRVRAALVTALGVLGRTRDESLPGIDVLPALAAELKSPHAAVSSAAAAALEQFHDQPAVVIPLLEYLAQLPASDAPEVVETKVKALQAIAANSPSTIMPDLLPFTDLNQLPEVRAAAVRALMACDNISTVLDNLFMIYSSDSSRDVRFGIAASLGDRFDRLASNNDTEVRTRMVGLLGNLLNDPDASVRAQAAEALGRSGSRSALTLLATQARRETEPTVQLRLVGALGALRQPEAAAAIGALLVSRKDKEGHAALLAEAQKALELLASDRAPEPWLATAESLHTAGAHDLAAYCCREARRRFVDVPEHREAVGRAQGLLALELLHDGQAREARTLLEELETAGAPFPARDERLLALADACERLEDWGAQADWLLLHLAELPAGDVRHDADTLAAVGALRKKGRNAEAAGLLRPYVEANPADNQALFDLAILEEALDRLDEARLDLDRLVKRLPESDALREQVLEAHRRVAARQVDAPASPAPDGGQQQESAEGSGFVPSEGGTGDGADGASSSP